MHEFDFDEFRAELDAVFPHVSLFLENHVEGVTFQPQRAPATPWKCGWMRGEAAPDESHFFVAVCAHRPQIGNPTFVYVPRAANVLRERERHIALLEGELATKNEWLAEALERPRRSCWRNSREQKEELERSNRWAETLNRELEERGARIVELQDELARAGSRAQMAAGYDAKVAELEAGYPGQDPMGARRGDALGRSAEADRRPGGRRGRAASHREGTGRAHRLGAAPAEGSRASWRSQLALVRASRWMKLGRKVGLGPGLPPADMAFLKRLLRALPLLCSRRS